MRQLAQSVQPNYNEIPDASVLRESFGISRRLALLLASIPVQGCTLRHLFSGTPRVKLRYHVSKRIPIRLRFVNVSRNVKLFVEILAVVC